MRRMTRTEMDHNLKAAAQLGTPLEVVDPTSQEIFYLVSAEQFQRIAGVLSGDFDPREGYPMIEKLMAEDDANDPLLDSYQ